MWTWANEEKTAAYYIAENEHSIFCGINLEPLYSLLENGLEPNPYVGSIQGSV